MEPWRFELRVEPNMIKEVRITDQVLECRIGEVDRIMEDITAVGKGGM